MKKTFELVVVNNNEVTVDSRTIEIPKFVADADKWVAHLRTIYRNAQEAIIKESISKKEEDKTSFEEGSLEHKNLLLEIELLSKKLEKLKEVHAGYEYSAYPVAENDRVAELFLAVYGYIPAPGNKDMDKRFKSIHADMKIFYSRYSDVKEITPERTAEFKSIMGELISYLNGVFKQEGVDGIYKKHSVRKLSVGFVNDAINYCYGATSANDKDGKKTKATGALVTKRKQCATVYKEVVTKYFATQQESSKVVG